MVPLFLLLFRSIKALVDIAPASSVDIDDSACANPEDNSSLHLGQCLLTMQSWQSTTDVRYIRNRAHQLVASLLTIPSPTYATADKICTEIIGIIINRPKQY